MRIYRVSSIQKKLSWRKKSTTNKVVGAVLDVANKTEIRLRRLLAKPKMQIGSAARVESEDVKMSLTKPAKHRCN